MSKNEKTKKDLEQTVQEDDAFQHVEMMQNLPNRMDIIAGLSLRDQRIQNQTGKKDYQGPLYAPHPDIKK